MNRITRRDFIELGAKGATLAAFAPTLFAADQKYPFTEFEEVIKAVGWNPNANNAFYLVQVTDLHINDVGPTKMENKYKNKNFVDDINRLSPLPDLFVETGDMVSDTMRSQSYWPRARAGFADMRSVLDKMNPKIKQQLIIGNNGCSWEMFKEVWPDRMDYWSMDHKGIHFVGINGYKTWKPENSNHAGIVLDDEQYQWLRKDLAGRESQTLVLYTHEPLPGADCHLIQSQILPLLKEWTGEVWNIAGHNHRNACMLWKLPKTTMRVVETTTPIGAWAPTFGAYRILFVENGKITGSALRWLTCHGEPLGFEIEKPQEKWSVFKPIQESFGDKLLWIVMVGAGDKEMRVESHKVEDRLSNLRISKGGSVVYRIPAGKVPSGAMLMLFLHPECEVDISADGKEWRKVEKCESRRMNGTVLYVSDGLVSGAVKDCYVKIAPQDGKEIRLYGIGTVKS